MPPPLLPPLLLGLATAALLGSSHRVSAPHATASAAGTPQVSAAAQERPTDLRVLVPAYFYPVPGSPWARLDAAAAAHPARVFAIGNPGSGPGAQVDPTYTTTFQSFRANGGRLLAYVYTSYAQRPLEDVLADVDTWLSFYAVDGFFLDEMSNVGGVDEPYYLTLTQGIEARKPGAITVGNPGTSTQPSYLFFAGQRVVSTLCIFENSIDFLSWTPDPWVQHYAGRNFYALPHTIPAAQWQAYVDHAYAENCGWIYCTDDTLPNPWDTLPGFFESLVAYVDATY